MRNDITIGGNVIGGRQGWAYTCNSNEITVLKVDLDKKHEYEEYKTFDMVKVAWNYRGNESHVDGRLEVENGKWVIGGWGCCIHSQFGYGDMKELIEGSNRQIIKEGKIVALAMISEEYKVATLALFKVGKVNIHCQVIAHLEPLTDEEMEEVRVNANRWCDR